MSLLGRPVETALNDIAATVQTLSSTHTAYSIANETATLNPMHFIVTELQSKFDTFSSSVNARLDQLTTVCQTSLGAHNRFQPNITVSQDYVDRQLNIILFGVPKTAMHQYGVTALITFCTLSWIILLYH